MAVKKVHIQVAPSAEGMRLDDFLAKNLPEHLSLPFSKAKARKLIMVGAVHLNRQRCKIASKPLRKGAVVEVYVDAAKLYEGRINYVPLEIAPQQILFEDRHIIVVNKPPGIPTQPTLDQARDHLYAAVQRFLAKREQKPEIYVGLHHRLDHDTSGVVLFTKSKQANPGVSKIFKDHLAKKSYMALVHKTPGHELPTGEWEIKNFLAKDPSSKKKMRMKSVSSGGDSAHTIFRVLQQNDTSAMVLARPLTGRTHQIRVHLKEQGLPIWGDRTYGLTEEKVEVPRLMLHAFKLEFPHPITNRPIIAEAPVPLDFQKAIESLLPGKHHPLPRSK